MDRRTLISTGILGSAALSLSGLLKADASASRSSRDLSCIMVWLQGGPSSLDMWDLKPAAPAEVRGPFRPIRTNVAGIEICEHLPLVARLAHNFCLVRSVSHSRQDHDGAAHLMSTGWDTWPAQPRPACGSTIQQLLGTEGSLPLHVRLPRQPSPAPAVHPSLDLGLTDAEGGTTHPSRLEAHLVTARRLVEAGTRFVTVVDPDWDSHADLFVAYENELLPRLDRALYRLLSELDERGLLETTLVLVMGEFSRSPKINPDAGRDHWGQVQTVFLAGGGIPGGIVVGASDAHGAYSSERMISTHDFAATLYHKLDVPLDAAITASNGLPVPLLPLEARPIPELI